MMKQKRTLLMLALLATTVAHLQWQRPGEHDGWIKADLATAGEQINAMAQRIGDSSKIPATIRPDGNLFLVNLYDWRSGFFSGSMWYLYEYTRLPMWQQQARRWTAALAPLQWFTDHHDLGFMVYCSYGAGYRLTGDTAYKTILVNAAKSLCTRFSEKTGAIKSWNTFKSWTDGTVYHYPVIIDNMMNLELLFFASQVTGDPYYKNVAIKHANTTLKHHFRKDYSAYHVVNYDSSNGQVMAKESAQGYAHESAWARGQAWALYGYTTTYRWTNDKRYLAQAKGIARYLMQHPNLPADKVPYWDYHAGQPGYTPCGPNAARYAQGTQPRDASAAAIIASALLELSDYSKGREKQDMIAFAASTLQSLHGPAYRSTNGSGGGYLLQHSVGSIPHGGEIDVPLVYADYYYLEALLRLQQRQATP